MWFLFWDQLRFNSSIPHSPSADNATSPAKCQQRCETCKSRSAFCLHAVTVFIQDFSCWRAASAGSRVPTGQTLQPASNLWNCHKVTMGQCLSVQGRGINTDGSFHTGDKKLSSVCELWPWIQNNISTGLDSRLMSCLWLGEICTCLHHNAWRGIPVPFSL